MLTPSLVPGDRSDRNRKALPGDQLHGLLVLQRAGADFRALKIGENPDGLGEPRGSFPQTLDRPRVIVMRSVRKIEPRHVHSGAHQPLDHFRRITGGSESAYNFSAAKIHGFCPSPFCLEGGMRFLRPTSWRRSRSRHDIGRRPLCENYRQEFVRRRRARVNYRFRSGEMARGHRPALCEGAGSRNRWPRWKETAPRSRPEIPAA